MDNRIIFHQIRNEPFPVDKSKIKEIRTKENFTLTKPKNKNKMRGYAIR